MTTDVVLFRHPESKTVERQLAALEPRFAAVLGAIMRPERLIHTIMLSLERTPKLFECPRDTLLSAAMTAACLGLEPDGVTGQSFILPFKKKGTPRAQLITGYKGYNTLAGRGGFAIRGDVVREGDTFEYDKAAGVIVHRMKALSSTGRIIGTWARAVSNSLPAIVEVISIDELMELKARAPGGGTSESPWNDPKIGFPAMCAKTAKRRLGRSMPLNLHLQAMHYASRLDEAVEEQGRTAHIRPLEDGELGARDVVIEGEIVESPIPPSQPAPPAIDLTPAQQAWPDLPPAIATRVVKFVDFLNSSQTAAGLDTRWKHRDSVALREQVRLISSAAADKLADVYDKRRVLLKEAEQTS